MSHPILRNKFIIVIRSAIQEAQALDSLNHPGIEGQVREVLAGKLIRPFIGPHIDIGTGKIIDSTGNVSDQQDLVLYSSNVLPPLLYNQSLGVFPIESCLYAIEVKTTLSFSKLTSSVNAAAKIKSFKYTERVAHVNSALFAFGTDLQETGKSEIDRYRDCDLSGNQNPAIKAFCIVGRGYWWFCREGNDARWHFVEPSSDYDEVIAFISGIVNTIPAMIKSKGYPKYGHYIAENTVIHDV